MRFIFTFILSLAVYHWSLDELQLISPDAAAYTESVAQKIRIPTHNRWPTEEFMAFMEGDMGFEEFLSDAWAKMNPSDEERA